ncbi:MAG: copper amine oxidase N-terminal domain-containing protein [Defluviitaleaceae bacterium]|nr:copper amine oxidase N-terminal domain-containing protein [Defluviitaleaceae bacterium]
MFRVAKKSLRKLLRGAFIASAVFVLLCTPVFAFNWEDSALPPGNMYFPVRTMPEISAVSSWDSEMLTDRPLTRREQGLDIRGRVPDITDSFDAASSINDHITNDIVTSLIGEARRLRARSISFRYDYHPTDDVISLVIYASVATTLPHTLVRSVNFCAFGGQLLSMNDAAQMEITPLAERILAEKIRSNPEHYYAALSAPFATAFYMTNDRLVILFDGFRLSTRIGDVETIELLTSNIKTVILTPDDYRQNGPYGLKMIPLRDMLQDRLGFDVSWDDAEHRAIISRNNTNLIELRSYDNEYIVLGTQRRSLEAAPQMFEDRMYIPITFFDQILPLTTFSIDFDGNITFLSYISD